VSGFAHGGRAAFGALAALLLVSAPAHGQMRHSACEELQTFSGVLNHIRNNYVDTISYRRMVRAAIDGVLESLDPHSHFLSRSDNVVLGRLARGDLAGIGMYVEPVGDEIVVRTLDRGGPSEDAGVFPGDRLLAVNDTSVAGLDAPRILARLAGPDGSSVRLLLARGPHLEPQEFELEIERKVFHVSAVEPAQLLDSATVYVRVVEFGDEAARDLETILGDARDGDRRQAILDLRGNPGGLVAEAVSMAGLFLPKRTRVFSTRGRKRDANADYMTEDDGDLRDVRLLLLIDEGSASAAEALAGALQDLDRAVVLGRRSFGKALVQAPFFLPGGDVVWLTIGRVQTPSGRVIQREYRGLTADQYRSFAGTGVANGDTLPLYRTAAGRPVRGGGGIAPDIPLPGPPHPPAWWPAVRARGWIQTIVDDAAADLPPGADAVDAWAAARSGHLALADALLERARGGLGVTAEVTPDIRAWMGRTIAGRVASVRWGLAASSRFRVATDPDVEAARSVFPDWSRVLTRTLPAPITK